jgi:hypothetical protein
MAIDWAKAAKIAGMLSSNRDGEILAAARKLIAICGDVHALAARIEHGARSGRHEIIGMAACTKRCRYCGREFIGKATARYCSPICRLHAHRQRQARRR